ncbi:hypothetical protein CC79DRAFT_867638 [Sarocladium strictum]
MISTMRLGQAKTLLGTTLSIQVLTPRSMVSLTPHGLQFSSLFLCRCEPRSLGGWKPGFSGPRGPIAQNSRAKPHPVWRCPIRVPGSISDHPVLARSEGPADPNDDPRDGAEIHSDQPGILGRAALVPTWALTVHDDLPSKGNITLLKLLHQMEFRTNPQGLAPTVSTWPGHMACLQFLQPSNGHEL